MKALIRAVREFFTRDEEYTVAQVREMLVTGVRPDGTKIDPDILAYCRELQRLFLYGPDGKLESPSTGVASRGPDW